MAWYTSIGFTVIGTHENHGQLDYVILSLGMAQIAFSAVADPHPSATSLWLHTDRIDDLYLLLSQRQLRAMRSATGQESAVRVLEDLYEPFYGGRQFSIADNNGVPLIFYEPSPPNPST